ncbi:hypothetical protein PG996_003262 [Apiospora saccharicola]|uniref:Uncharacterized protein n=1 Tax=Apiospora saccharicola TaxID=335842 RepID=A0ABR1W206_9PEZI
MYDTPTEDEMKTLRRVTDKVPIAIYLVAIAEIAEQFAFRSLTGTMLNKSPACEQGQATATALGYFFQFWCYMTPIVGAVVADSYLGRFKTIFSGAVLVFNPCPLLCFHAQYVNLMIPVLPPLG